MRSRKPSATTRLREETTFFLDRMLGKYKCAEGLKKANLKVIVHDDKFPQKTEDETWIHFCAEQSWVIFTGDRWGRGRKESAQIKAVASGNVRVFQLATNEIPSELWAQAILKAEGKILKILKKHNGPFMARITPGGNVTMLEGYFDEEQTRAHSNHA